MATRQLRKSVRDSSVGRMIRTATATQEDVSYTAAPFPRVFAWCNLSVFWRKLAVVAAFVLLFSLLCCGYHFPGSGGEAPGDIRNIAVDVLDNRTAEIGIETLFTNAIINEFVRWKKLPVKSRSEADAVLGGSIREIKTESVSRRRADITLETRVTVTLALTLKRTDTGEILWRNRALRYFDEYVETGDALATKRLRNEAFAEIAKFLAEKIHLSMFEQF